LVSPHSLTLSPLDKGGEGRGEGGFESNEFTNFGSAVGITQEAFISLQDSTQGAGFLVRAGD